MVLPWGLGAIAQMLILVWTQPFWPCISLISAAYSFVGWWMLRRSYSPHTIFMV